MTTAASKQLARQSGAWGSGVCMGKGSGACQGCISFSARPPAATRPRRERTARVGAGPAHSADARASSHGRQCHAGRGAAHTAPRHEDGARLHTAPLCGAVEMNGTPKKGEEGQHAKTGRPATADAAAATAAAWRGRAAPTASASQLSEGPGLQRVPGPVAAPGVLRPHRADDQHQRLEDEGESRRSGAPARRSRGVGRRRCAGGNAEPQCCRCSTGTAPSATATSSRPEVELAHQRVQVQQRRGVGGGRWPGRRRPSASHAASTASGTGAAPAARRAVRAAPSTATASTSARLHRLLD
jgi:hypothetical protein